MEKINKPLESNSIKIVSNLVSDYKDKIKKLEIDKLDTQHKVEIKKLNDTIYSNNEKHTAKVYDLKKEIYIANNALSDYKKNNIVFEKHIYDKISLQNILDYLQKYSKDYLKRYLKLENSYTGYHYLGRENCYEIFTEEIKNIMNHYSEIEKKTITNLEISKSSVSDAFKIQYKKLQKEIDSKDSSIKEYSIRLKEATKNEKYKTNIINDLKSNMKKIENYEILEQNLKDAKIEFDVQTESFLTVKKENFKIKKELEDLKVENKVTESKKNSYIWYMILLVIINVVSIIILKN